MKYRTFRSRAEPKAPLFAVYVEDWMATYVVPNNKPSTIASKRSKLDRHIIPFFGAMTLCSIDRLAIDRYKATKLEQGLARKTINNHLTILRRALDVAKEWGLIRRVPTFQWMQNERPGFDFFTADESERLLGSTTGLQRVMILTALRTGMRRGELLALRWANVDLDKRRIRVAEAISDGVVTAPKNHKARFIPISVELAAALRSLDQDGPYVFHGEGGTRLTTDEVKRLVPYACDDAGLRRLNWHALRHSFASQLVMAGVDIRTVQELLGHSNVTQTMRYAHLAPGHLEDAVAVLDRRTA